MGAPLSTEKNPYWDNKKKSNIENPLWLAEEIELKIHASEQKVYSSICPVNKGYKSPLIDKVYDIGCNNGNLSLPFELDYDCIGIDIKKYKYHSKFIRADIFDHLLKLETGNHLILCNPPFNNEGKKTKMEFELNDVLIDTEMLAEAFLLRIFQIWGTKAKVVLIVPMGFRLNQWRRSTRWKWLRDLNIKITSITSLLVDTFEETLFHQEVLFFNIPYIEAHSWIKCNPEPFEKKEKEIKEYIETNYLF